MNREERAAKREQHLKEGGKDAFGGYQIMVAVCDVCGVRGLQAVYVPTGFSLPEGIDVAKTILRKPGNKLGISCGCYAKFHRQVAHIQDAMKARGSS